MAVMNHEPGTWGTICSYNSILHTMKYYLAEMYDMCSGLVLLSRVLIVVKAR
jgi:hypothetical protein